VLLIPLAVTSTSRMIRRLGGKRWQLLHRLVYVSAFGGVVHYLWLVKADIHRPLIYGGVLSVLLTFRFWSAFGESIVAQVATLQTLITGKQPAS
jgi:methionine sulfoxide reductase heme-binding subunit